jgi:hypothetical protein
MADPINCPVCGGEMTENELWFRIPKTPQWACMDCAIDPPTKATGGGEGRKVR